MPFSHPRLHAVRAQLRDRHRLATPSLYRLALWAVAFGPHEGIKFQAMISGSCWLAIERVGEPIRIGAGDCYLLPRGRPFRLASDLALTPVDAMAFLQAPLRGAVRTVNGGGDCFAIGGHFAFAGKHAEMLLGMLPPIVHLRSEADKAAMRWSVERLMLELREPQPGGFLIAQQLAHMLLVQALRLHLRDDAGKGVGWLFALADRQVSAALTAMHAQPGRRWTIEALAKEAAMSRSTFALKFKRLVGRVADGLPDALAHAAGGRPAWQRGRDVSALAPALGYESESAFSTAFKRVMGAPPRHYGRGQEAASQYTVLVPA